MAGRLGGLDCLDEAQAAGARDRIAAVGVDRSGRLSPAIEFGWSG